MKIENVRELSNVEIATVLNTQKRALMNVRFGVATRQISDTAQLQKIRRDVARLMTVIREREIVTYMQQGDTAAPRPVEEMEQHPDPEEPQETLSDGEQAEEEEGEPKRG